jgi:hypothetical protein
MRSALRIQRLWIGAVTRLWLRDLNSSATFIQKHVRGLLVRSVLGDKAGREIHKRFKRQLTNLMETKSDLEESDYHAQVSALMGRMREQLHEHREKDVDIRRMTVFSLRSNLRIREDKERRLKMKGAIQPARVSVFEPMAITLRNLEPKKLSLESHSRIMVEILKRKKVLDQSIPKEAKNKAHIAARRGRAAVYMRSLARKPKEEKQVATMESLVEDSMYDDWAAKQFSVKEYNHKNE